MVIPSTPRWWLGNRKLNPKLFSWITELGREKKSLEHLENQNHKINIHISRTGHWNNMLSFTIRASADYSGSPSLHRIACNRRNRFPASNQPTQHRRLLCSCVTVVTEYFPVAPGHSFSKVNIPWHEPQMVEANVETTKRSTGLINLHVVLRTVVSLCGCPPINMLFLSQTQAYPFHFNRSCKWKPNIFLVIPALRTSHA